MESLLREEITQRTYDEYERVCDRVAESIGKHRLLADLHTGSLDRLKTDLSRGKRGELLAPKTLSKDLNVVRSIFLFANENLLERPIKYRRPLASPSRRIMRQAANATGPRMFSADEIQTILKAADPTMQALVYLGINCAFGPRDCALLPVGKLDLEGGWHSCARKKTGVMRRAKLWPETVDALLAVIVPDRPLVFDLPVDSRSILSPEFRELLTGLKIYRKNVTTFYSLRRTFETVAQTAGDQPAVDCVMGHTAKTNDMAAVYRQKVYDAQLAKVAEHVRRWLRKEISID